MLLVMVVWLHRYFFIPIMVIFCLQSKIRSKTSSIRALQKLFFNANWIIAWNYCTYKLLLTACSSHIFRYRVGSLFINVACEYAVTAFYYRCTKTWNVDLSTLFSRGEIFVKSKRPDLEWFINDAGTNKWIPVVIKWSLAVYSYLSCLMWAKFLCSICWSMLWLALITLSLWNWFLFGTNKLSRWLFWTLSVNKSTFSRNQSADMIAKPLLSILSFSNFDKLMKTLSGRFESLFEARSSSNSWFKSRKVVYSIWEVCIIYKTKLRFFT